MLKRYEFEYDHPLIHIHRYKRLFISWMGCIQRASRSMLLHPIDPILAKVDESEEWLIIFQTIFLRDSSFLHTHWPIDTTLIWNDHCVPNRHVWYSWPEEQVKTGFCSEDDLNGSSSWTELTNHVLFARRCAGKRAFSGLQRFVCPEMCFVCFFAHKILLCIEFSRYVVGGGSPRWYPRYVWLLAVYLPQRS